MGKIAFVFAGQGAQYVGMGQSVYRGSACARRAMDQAEAIRPGTLHQCFRSDLGTLSQTVNTQPCLFLVDYACALAVMEIGIGSDMVAGFSLGEVAAAAFSGMLRFEDAFRLVIRRAELMQAAADLNPGRMVAVLRLTSEQVQQIAEEFDSVYPVNFNCPGQTVVACSAESFDPFCARVTELRGRAVPLNVSGAFHSPFMAEASAGIGAYLQSVQLHDNSIPLYSNVTASPYSGDRARLLSEQIKCPVLWQQTILNMHRAGATTFIELGAGTTLSGLIKKTLDPIRVYSVADMDDLVALQEGLR